MNTPENLPGNLGAKGNFKDRWNQELKTPAKKLATIIGGLFLFIFLVLGVVSAATSASKFARKMTSEDKKEEIITVVTGKPFITSWNHLSKSTDGFYTISYPCKEGFFLEATTPARGKETVFCNEHFRFISEGNELELTASSTKNEVTLPLSIYFTKNGSKNEKFLGTIQTLVANPGASSTNIVVEDVDIDLTGIVPVSAPSQPVVRQPGTRTEQTYPITTPAGGSGTVGISNPSGRPDIRPIIIETGYMSGSTFVKASEVRRSDRAAIRFSVENLGTKETGPWRFNAVLPTFPSYTFNSDTQVSMLPGDKVEFTLGFDRIIEGTNTVSIIVDPSNSVSNELDENNNQAFVSIRAL